MCSESAMGKEGLPSCGQLCFANLAVLIISKHVKWGRGKEGAGWSLIPS